MTDTENEQVELLKEEVYGLQDKVAALEGELDQVLAELDKANAKLFQAGEELERTHAVCRDAQKRLEAANKVVMRMALQAVIAILAGLWLIAWLVGR